MALSKDRKKALISDLHQSITDNPALIFTDFGGSSVKNVEAFRTQLRAEGATYKVVKKTLFVKALQAQDVEVALDHLPGNLGVVFATDPVSGAKISTQFAKKAPKDTFKVVGGVLEKGYLDAAQVVALSKLPTKEELQAQLVGTMVGPTRGFVTVLSGPARGLVTLLSAYRDSK